MEYASINNFCKKERYVIKNLMLLTMLLDMDGIIQGISSIVTPPLLFIKCVGGTQKGIL